jgi:hypothetical protein
MGTVAAGRSSRPFRMRANQRCSWEHFWIPRCARLLDVVAAELGRSQLKSVFA